MTTCPRTWAACKGSCKMTLGEEQKFYQKLKRAVLADDQRMVEILSRQYPKLFAKVIRKAERAQARKEQRRT